MSVDLRVFNDIFNISDCIETGLMMFDSPQSCGYISPARDPNSDFDLLLMVGSELNQKQIDALYIHPDHVDTDDMKVFRLLESYLIGVDQVCPSRKYLKDGAKTNLVKTNKQNISFLLEGKR